MSKFEDHLWREFVHEHGDDLAKLTRSAVGHNLRRWRLIVGGSLGLASGATALALVLSATSALPAFAVTRNHNGTVTVTIRRASGIAGANAELHQLGIRAQVAKTPPVGCQPVQVVSAPPPGTGTATSRWTINPAAIAASQTVVLTPPPAGNSGTTGVAGNSGTSGPNPASNQVWRCAFAVSSALGKSATSGPNPASNQVERCAFSVTSARAGVVTGNSGTSEPSGAGGPSSCTPTSSRNAINHTAKSP